MTPEDKLDRMVNLAAAASSSDLGHRLTQSVVTDALVTRAVCAMGATVEGAAKTMTRGAILDLAEREFDTLDPDQRQELADAVLEHVNRQIVAATKHAWTVATMLGYDVDSIAPEGVAFIAACLCIPPDAGALEDQNS